MNGTDPSGLVGPNTGTRADLWQQEVLDLRRRAIQQQMRDALEKVIAHLSAEEQEEARAELELLFAVADSVPRRLRTNDCVLWRDEVMKKLPHQMTYITIGNREWDFCIGIPWTDWCFGHVAIKVTIGDHVFYLDNGMWGRYFRSAPIGFVPYAP